MEELPYIPFGGSEIQAGEIQDARVVVLPIYYEVAPSYGGGSREGPFHLLTASIQLERMDEETGVDWGDAGIFTLPPFIPSEKPEEAVHQIAAFAEPFIRSGAFLLSLGGDHAISIGLIKAFSKVYPAAGILQVDAHLDLRETWNNSRYNHACVMRRVAEETGLSFVQVGIRSFSPEEAQYIKKNNLRPFFAHQLDPRDHAWMDEAVSRLPETVYLTIDLDGLDPSVIPGTGTPEPGGLTYRQLVELIKRLGQKRRVVAADINELAKIEGSQVSEYTAAKIATKLFVHCL